MEVFAIGLFAAAVVGIPIAILLFNVLAIAPFQ